MSALNQQTLQKLIRLRLRGMATGFESQLANSASHDLAFEERLALLVDQEISYKENTRLQRLLKMAKLREAACIEDLDYRPARGLDRSQMASLAMLEWVPQGLNLIFTGPTGSGKTWLACAFGNHACRKGFTVSFQRLALLLEELAITHGDGSFRKRLMQLAKYDVLILDDLGMTALTATGRADLMEVIEQRSGGRPTIVTSQIPVSKWHDYLSGGNPTVADAILDRLLSGSIRLELQGESMRKLRDKH
ncbi:MAG: IS21-like element helper ATPase IstB [Gammaproteobacteria bacterium]